MPDAIFLELEDHIGIEPDHIHSKDGEITDHPSAGEPGPLVEEGCAFAVPTLVDGEVLQLTRHVKIRRADEPVGSNRPIALESEVSNAARIIPGSRQIETTDPQLASALEQGGYRRVDPPKSNAKARAASGKGEADTGQEG